MHEGHVPLLDSTAARKHHVEHLSDVQHREGLLERGEEIETGKERIYHAEPHAGDHPQLEKNCREVRVGALEKLGDEECRRHAPRHVADLYQVHSSLEPKMRLWKNE